MGGGDVKNRCGLHGHGRLRACLSGTSVFALLVIHLTACSGTHPCAIVDDAECAEKIHRWSGDNPTTLVMVDATKTAVSNVTIGRDSVNCWVMAAAKYEDFARDSILTIRIRRSGKGAARGLVNGLLAGGVMGALMGYTGSGDWDPTSMALVGAAALGAAGGLIGLVAGGISGYTEIFQLQPPRADIESSLEPTSDDFFE
jgi:hypothetical protein